MPTFAKIVGFPEDEKTRMAADQDGRRQVVSFSFYRLMPEWRRLAVPERTDQRRELADVIGCCNGDRMRTLTYSTVGTRADCDLLLWRIAYSLEDLQKMSADVARTRLGGYLQTPYSYLGMTRRSQYKIKYEQDEEGRPVVQPGKFRYLFVYPFVKTHDWYALPFEQRQRLVSEQIKIAHDFPRVRMHTAYSFGLDDQEYVLAFGTDHPDDFSEMMMRWREVDNYGYTQRDNPVFTCVQTNVEEMLEKLG